MATVSKSDLIEWARLWPTRAAVAVPRWRHTVASGLMVACVTVPDAAMHAKWFKLSLVTGLAYHRYVAPTT